MTAGLFWLSLVPARAELSIAQMRDTVERYAAARDDATERVFFIDPIVVRVEGEGVAATQQPLVVGLTANNTNIRIFIDDILVDTVPVYESEGEVAIFAYQPQWLLAQDMHSVYVQAVNGRGTVSKRSNRLYFSVNDALVPQISATRIERAEEAVLPASARVTITTPLLNFTNQQALALTEVVAVTNGGVDRSEAVLFGIIIILLAGWLWRERRLRIPS